MKPETKFNNLVVSLYSKQLVKNPRSNYRVHLFASRLKESNHSMDTVRYSWESDRLSWIFQKESILYGNSYNEKEEGRPYSFNTFHMFHAAFFIDIYKHPPPLRKSGKWTQKEQTRRKSVYLPRASKTMFMNTVKKSRLIELTLSRISLFWIKAQFP